MTQNVIDKILFDKLIIHSKGGRRDSFSDGIAEITNFG
jgi:hypothetical protein